MWLLCSKNDSHYYLWEKQSFTVGRKNTDIIISNDDSISRNHASVEIDNNNIFLIDKGSKYGTFVAGTKLNKDEKRKLHENDEIKFGLLQSSQSTFLLHKLKLKVITSNVKPGDKQDLQRDLDYLKATRAAAWHASCTHLVVSEVILTVKVLCALTQGQPIVNVKYFRDYVTAVQNNSPLPDVKNYVPEINETLLSKNIKLELNANRKVLFRGKMFVFLTEKYKNQMEELIGITGGTAISWEKNELPLDKLNTDTEYLFMEENLDGVNENSHMYKSFKKAVRHVSAWGRRSIPCQEIALAIVQCSCAENCNPLFNRAALLVAGSQPPPAEPHILAYDTQHASAPGAAAAAAAELEVPPSYESEPAPPPGSAKRRLEPDAAASQPHKRARDSVPQPPACSQRTVATTTSSSTTATHCSTLNLPSRPDTQTNQHDNMNVQQAENPFTRKRKSNKPLETVTKKRPFENIINVQQCDSKSNHAIQDSSTIFANTTQHLNIKTDVSTIIKCSTWLSNTSIKKEINDSGCGLDKENYLEDEDLIKLNAAFKNTIHIELIPIVEKSSNAIRIQNDDSHVGLPKNFKKFKKINQSYIQSEIISDREMVKYVIGRNENNDDIDDDENDVSDEHEEELLNHLHPPQRNNNYNKRKYKYCV